MNVLFVASWYPSKWHDTNGNFIEQHARAVQEVGVNVRVVHIIFSNRILLPHISTEIRNGIKVNHVAIPRVLRHKASVKNRVFEKLVAQLENETFTPEIIHGHVVYPGGELALFLAEHFQIPLVYTEHWSGYKPINSDKFTPEVAALTRQVLDRTKLIMPVSNELGENMRNRGFSGDYYVVNNTVNTDIFRFRQRPKNAMFQFLHVSNFEAAAKNVEGMMRAFLNAGIPNAHLTVAGDGDPRPLVKFLNSQSSDVSGITLKGKMDYDEVARHMQMSDCFLLFSNYENLPCVIAEAHCCGIPVLATHVGGIPEMVHMGNGVLVAPGNEDELQSAMREMVARANSFNKRKIRDEAVDRYSYKVIGTEFLTCYNRVLSRDK